MVMKTRMKLIVLWVVALLVSCQDKYETEYEPTGLLAGQWVVSDAGDPESDAWTLYTSNTPVREAGKLLLTDKGVDAGGFWDFTVSVAGDPQALTFGQADAVENQWYYVQEEDPVIVPYDIQVIVKDGRVERDAVSLPSGAVADKITFILAFGDDDPEFHEYTMVGYRYSGFMEDAGYVYRE